MALGSKGVERRDADDVVHGFVLLDTPSVGRLDAARLRALLDAANDVFFEVDLVERTMRWTRAIALVLGREAAGVGSRVDDWQSAIHPADAPAVAEAARRLLRETAPAAQCEFRIARADGTYVPVRARAVLVRDQSGTPARVVGAVTDLSAIRGLEGELQEANERLRLQLARERQERIRGELLMRATTTDVLLEWWLGEDRIVWSPNVQELLGYPASRLLSPADVAARAPEIAADLDETRRRIASGTTSAWSRRFTWLLPSGERLELEAQAYVLCGADEVPERVIGSMRRVPAAEPDRPRPDLTMRQRQVLSLVRLGHTNKEIASALGISEQAAKVQVSKLLRKLGVSNRAALAVAGRSYASL